MAEINNGQYHQALSFLLRATDNCTKKCNTLKLKGNISDKEE